MKIPIIQAETKVPATTYPVEPSGLMAQAAASSRVQGLIDSIVSEQGKILEKQKRFNQSMEIGQAETDVLRENQKLVTELQTNPDPNNYYKNWEAGFEKISKNRLSKIIDPETRKIAQITFQKMMAQNMVAQGHEGKMIWLKNQKGERLRLTNEYINNGQPQKAIDLIEEGIPNIYDPEEGARIIIGIKDKAEKKQKEDNYANAFNMIITDPSEETLNKAIQLFKIPTEEQATLRKQQRIERDAQERQKKEVGDLARDKEDNEIATEYLKKNYSEVYRRAQSPKSLLTAERRTYWGDHAEAAARRKEEVEPGEEAGEIAYINQIIRKDVSPQVVKDYIITTPRLNETTKKQQIEKIEKYVNKEINMAARRSYEYLRKEIISPSGIAGVMAKSIPENVRAANYAKAQLALDDWLDKQQMTDKPISGTDILTKAEEIVKLYRPKFDQKTPIIQKNTTDMIKGLGELGELSKGKATEVAPKEGKTKQTKYKSVEEVRNAYNRKELTHAEAKEILIRDFGAK